MNMGTLMSAEESQRRALDALDLKDQFDAKVAELDERAKFDASFGVDTSEPVETWEMDDTEDIHLINNARYSPTPVRTIREILAALPLRHEDVAFVDFGCGKGRAVLVASDFPFRKVIGVEFSQDLCAIAERNVTRYSSYSHGCRSIEIRHLDAADYAVPEDVGVCYFYEPFSATVAEKVLENIELSLRNAPRQVVLCLVGGLLIPVTEKRPAWKRVGSLLESPDDPYFNAWLFTNE